MKPLAGGAGGVCICFCTTAISKSAAQLDRVNSSPEPSCVPAWCGRLSPIQPRAALASSLAVLHDKRSSKHTPMHPAREAPMLSTSATHAGTTLALPATPAFCRLHLDAVVPEPSALISLITKQIQSLGICRP